jgi:hypothetical protein
VPQDCNPLARGFMQTHYDTLEVTETASPEVIRGAYRFLCQKWHPDKNFGQHTTAEEMTRALNIAYAVLSDPERRRAYDSSLRLSRSSAYSTRTQQASSNSPPINPARRDEHKPKTTGPSLARKSLLWGAIFIGLFILNKLRDELIVRPVTEAALHEVIPGPISRPPAARQSPAQPPASPTLAPYVPPAAAKIYTYLDSHGNRHYTDVPDNNRYRLLPVSPQDPTESGDPYDAQLLARATQFDSIIEHAAVSSALEPNLLRAMIVVGSGFNSRAVSKRGAVGLMQLMPATAARFGASNPFDPKQNVHAGARYLKFLIDRFGKDIRLALAAYNAGEEAVDDNGGQIPPFPETMAYVPRVLKTYRMLAEQPPTTKGLAGADALH